MGSDGCFLIGWMKEGRNRWPTLRYASSWKDAPDHAVRPCTGPHGVSCWLCICVFLEQAGGRLWWGSFHLHQDVLLASPLLHQESSQPSQSDVRCGWIQGTNMWAGASGGKAHFHPPSPTLSPLCPKRNLLKRKTCKKRDSFAQQVLVYTHCIWVAESTIPEEYVVLSIIVYV